MMSLTPISLASVAVIGAHCSDITIGGGATLMELVQDNPDLVIHALVLTGGGTDLEIEEKNAFAALCSAADVRLTVADLPDGRLVDHGAAVQKQLAEFRRDCEPDLVMGPQRADGDQDRRLVGELTPTEFPHQLMLGYEILDWHPELPNPSLYLPISPEVAQRKASLLTENYPSQCGRNRFDREALLGLLRVRGVQCRARYAEAFTVEKAVLNIDSDYSVN